MLQRALAFVVITLLLASCASQPSAVQAGQPCEAATFTVVDNFAGARRGSCAVLSDHHVHLTNRPEDEDVANPSAWYAFKLIPHATTTATITLQYVDGYHRYVPKTSIDGLRWNVIDEGSVIVAPDGLSATIVIALPDKPVWISAQELILPAMYDVWTQNIARQTDAKLRVLGMSGASQPIPVLTVNESAKEVLLLTGRQHPPEVSGAFAFFSFFETLVADTELANRFRERYQVLAIPLLNPDGVIGGNWRHNLGNTDLNRDWGPFKQPETRLIRDLLDHLDSKDKHIRVFLDFHSTKRNLFYTQDEEHPTMPPLFFRNWLLNAESRLTNYDFTNEENPVGKVGVSKNYMYKRYGIPSATYEVGDETDRQAARQAAIILAEELMILMLEQNYE